LDRVPGTGAVSISFRRRPRFYEPFSTRAAPHCATHSPLPPPAVDAAVKLYHARAYFSLTLCSRPPLVHPSRTDTRFPSSPLLPPPGRRRTRILSISLFLVRTAAAVCASLMYILVHYNMPNGCSREESFKNKASVRVERRGEERRKLLLLLLCVCHCRRHLYYIIIQ